MNKQIKGWVTACCALGTLLLSGQAWSLAESTDKTANAALDTMTLQELDQVVVHARQFEERLFEREQNFYRLYNKLNANDELDVSCDVWLADITYTRLATPRNKRTCLPNFLAQSIYTEAPVVAAVVQSSFRRTWSGGSYFNSPYLQPPVGAPEGGMPYEIVSYLNEPLGWSTGGSSFSAGQDAPRLIPQQSYQLFLSRRSEFEANLNKVMRSDAQLQSLGGEFQALVQERDDTRKTAVEARKLRAELRMAQRKCPLPSPRGLTKACKED